MRSSNRDVRWLTLIVHLLIMGLLASVSHAATYWVSTASTGAGDGNACVNSATPLTNTARRTINAGWNCLSAGDTLMVGSGTYGGLFFNNGRGGSAGSPKTLKPAPGATVILDSALTTHSGQGIITFWGSGANYVTIDGAGGILKLTDSATGPADHASLQPAWWPCQNLWVNKAGECNGLTPATDPGANMSCAQQIYDAIIAGRRGIDFDVLSSTTDHSHHIRILNVELTRLKQFALWGPTDDLEVSNNHIHNNDLYATYINGARHLIRNNHVHHNRSVGLRFGSDGQPSHPIIGKMLDGVIENNLVHDNFGRIFHVSGSAGASDLDSGGYGIICYGCANNLIKNNVVYNNSWNDRWGNSCHNWGVYVMDRLTGANQVYNNTIYGHNPASASDGPGFINAAFGGQNTIVRNNIIVNNKDNVVPGTRTVFSNNLCNDADTGCTIPNANPKFVKPEAGDFRLQEGSLAIDAGVQLSEVPVDFSGVARPAGARYDIGAYEYLTGIEKLVPPRNLHIENQ